MSQKDSTISNLENVFKKPDEMSEIISLLISIAVATIIFAYNWRNPYQTVESLPSAFLAVITAFLLHELAHRFVARKLSCYAVYQLWLPGIVFGLLMMLVGIKMILVGAVVISTYKFGRWGMQSKYPSMREIGIISASGPVTNLAIASIFKYFGALSIFGVSLSYLSFINTWIAVFNLVPIKPLDGSKVFFWNPRIWLGLVVAAIFILTPAHIFGPLFT